jgi:putative ATP-binding cassette transporter
MPQKPYLTVRTLREQFFYGGGEENETIEEKEIENLLEMVNMSYLLQRFNLDVVMDWPNVLSVGEQQRIGMARVLFRKPSHAVLDECTSAVPHAVELKFYELLKSFGCVFISVAHREAVINFFP